MKTDPKKTASDQTVAVNRRGRFEYDIEESIEAGLVLTGTEVKSARQGQVQISEAYASLEPGPSRRRSGEGSPNGVNGVPRNPEVWVHGMHIAPYKQGNMFNAEPRRKRKLLLHREQINKLIGRVQQKGYTLVPLKFYFTRGKAKLELGVGKGRQRHDKRHAIEEREIRREINTES